MLPYGPFPSCRNHTGNLTLPVRTFGAMTRSLCIPKTTRPNPKRGVGG